MPVSQIIANNRARQLLGVFLHERHQRWRARFLSPSRRIVIRQGKSPVTAPTPATLRQRSSGWPLSSRRTRRPADQRGPLPVSSNAGSRDHVHRFSGSTVLTNHSAIEQINAACPAGAVDMNPRPSVTGVGPVMVSQYLMLSGILDQPVQARRSLP